MNKIEVLIIKNAAKNVNFKACKQCKHYQHNDGKPHCSIEPNQSLIDDCSLAQQEIS